MEILTKEKQDRLFKYTPNKPIALPPAVIMQLEKATQGGTKDFHKGYQIISDYLGKKLGTAGLRYWFKKAVEINRNDDSSIANQHIRGANAEAAKIDGREMTPKQQQRLSDRIGTLILQTILKNKAVPKIEEIVQTDVVATLNQLPNAKKNDLSNWAGSYYFWNTPITLRGETKTIGAFITADKTIHDKFIKVQAGGVAQVWRSGSIDTISEGGEILKQIFDGERGPSAKDRLKIINGFNKNTQDPKSDIQIDKEEGAFLNDKTKQLILKTDENTPDHTSVVPPQAEKEPNAPHIIKHPAPRPENHYMLDHQPPKKNTILGATSLGAAPQVQQNTQPPLHFAQPRENVLAPRGSTSSLPRKFGAHEEPVKTVYTNRPKIDDGKIDALSPAEDDIDLAELTEPTPDMIANNVFAPDENGLTNLTEEAKIWKKNKKLALALINHAGRTQEFQPILDMEDTA